MTKISSKSVYPIKTPVKSDYFVGTNSENFGQTVNFGFEETALLVSKLNGSRSIPYLYDTSPYIATEVLEEGKFLSVESESNTAALSKLYVNTFDNGGENLSELYLFLKENAADFCMTLRNANDLTNAVYYTITSIEDFSDYFVFTIEVFKANPSVPLLVNQDVYFFDFELLVGRGRKITPTLQSVTEEGAETTNKITVNTTETVGINSIGASIGLVAFGSISGIVTSSDDAGIRSSGGNVGIRAEATTDAGIGGQFNIQLESSSNIVEFQKNSVTQASVTHDGNFNANAFVKTGGQAIEYLMADGSTSLAAATPTLQSVTEAGAETTIPISINVTSGIGLNVYATDGKAIYGNSTNNNGVNGFSFNDVGVVGISANYIGLSAFSFRNIAASFAIDSQNTFNIAEFVKGNVNQAFITHDGKVNANSFVKAGGLISEYLMADGSTSLAAATPSLQQVIEAGAETSFAINANSFIKLGGTADEILLANGSTSLLSAKANVNAPAFTGIATAPTPAAGTNTTQLATTAFASALVSDAAYDATSWNGVTGIAPSKNAVRDQIETVIALALESYSTQTGLTYTLQLSDANSKISFTNTTSVEVNVTIPTNNVVAFPIGTKIRVNRVGSPSTFGVSVSGAGVTFIGTNGTTTTGTGQTVLSLIKTNTNTWEVIIIPNFYVSNGWQLNYNLTINAYGIYANRFNGAVVGFDNQTNISFGQTTSFNKTGNNNSYSGVSGVQTGINTPISFLPTSGTGIYNNFTINPIINQTGGANGVTRGLYIDPTLTAAADFRAIEVVQGKVIIPNGVNSNEAVNKGQLDLKASVDSPIYTGTPSAPTAVSGTNTTQIATTAFVQDAVATSNAVLRTGNQTIVGLKSFTNFGNAKNVEVNNGNTQIGSSALFVTNSNNGKGILSENYGTGIGIYSNTSTAGTGLNYVGANNGTTTFSVDKIGTISGNSFVKAGASADEILLGNGSTALLSEKANAVAPTFTGTPLAPTAALGTNTTQIATTAFVLENASLKPIQVTAQTLVSTSWTLVSGFYEYNLANANITATSIVDVIPDNASIAIIKSADVMPRTLSGTGTVKLYATNLPTANITVTLNIFK